MLYELIIFTMMQPHVPPLWMHLTPTSESVCVERKLRFEELFEGIEGFIFSLECEPVEIKDDS